MLPTTNDLKELILCSDPIIYPSTANCFMKEYSSLPPELKQQYVFNEETQAYDLPEDIWLNWRKHGPYWFDVTDPRYIPYTIGGSDIGTLYDGSELSKVLHLYEGQKGSKYKSNIELWCEKIGIKFKYETNNNNTDIFFQGHIEEESIRQYFKRQYCIDHPTDKVKVWNDCHFYQSTVIPGLVCNTDGAVEVNGIRGVLECKTCQLTSPDRAVWKSGNVPLKYYLQCCAYMLCLNVPYSYICVKLGIGEIMYFYIERDLDVEKYIIKMIEEFLKCIEEGVEPDFSDQSAEIIAQYWRKKSGPYVPNAVPVELDISMLPILKEIGTCNCEIEILEQRKKEIEEKRFNILNKNIFPLFGMSNYGRIKISDNETMEIHLKKKPVRKPNINVMKLKEEMPQLYSHYVKSKEDFNSTLFRKENVTLVSRFEEESTTLTDEKQNYCELIIKS